MSWNKQISARFYIAFLLKSYICLAKCTLLTKTIASSRNGFLMRCPVAADIMLGEIHSTKTYTKRPMTLTIVEYRINFSLKKH